MSSENRRSRKVCSRRCGFDENCPNWPECEHPINQPAKPSFWLQVANDALLLVALAFVLVVALVAVSL
jgi:hypothetical protein